MTAGERIFQSAPNVWERLFPTGSMQRPRGQFIAFFALLTLLTLFMYNAFLRNPAYLIYYDVGSDSIGQSVPFFLNAAKRFSEMNFSTWNPSQFLGSPTTQLFNPEYFVSWFGADAVPTMMLVSQMLKVMLAGVFFYLFLGYYNVCYEARVVSSLGVAFCGRMLALAPWTAYTAEVTLLAALLWGAERAISDRRKFVGLPVSFALIVMTLSVYGFVLYTGVLVMYAAFSLGFRHPELNRKGILVTVGRLAVLYVCGFMLSSPALFVYLDSYAHSARVSSETGLQTILSQFNQKIDTVALSESFVKMLSPSVSGLMNDPISAAGFLDAPYFSCGLLALLGLPFAFRGRTPRERAWLAVLLVFSATYLLVPGFRFLLNGGSLGSNSFRMSSTWVILVLALIGALGLDQLLKKASVHSLAIWLAVLALFAALSVLQLAEHVFKSLVALSFLFLFAYAALLVARSKTGTAAFTLILLAMVPLEIVVQSYRLVSWVPAQSHESYAQTFESGLSELVERNAEPEQGPQRLDYQTDLLTSPMAYNYQGTQSYIGGVGTYDSVTALMDTLGNDYVHQLGYSRYSYGFSDPSLNAILGVHSLAYPIDGNSYYAPLGYQFSDVDKNHVLLANEQAPNYLSFFSADEAISQKDYLSLPRNERGRALLHAIVMPEGVEASSETATNELIDELSRQTDGETLGESTDSVTLSHQTDFDLSPADSDYVALCFDLNATATVSGNIHVMAELYRSENDTDPVIVPLYLAAGNETIYVPIPSDAFVRATVSITAVNNCPDPTLNNVHIEEVPEAYIKSYESGCAERRSAQSTFTSVSNDALTARVNAPEDGYLFSPIPNSASWHVFIDGEEVETFFADYAFIGFEIGEGEHTVELRYRDDAYLTGIALFAACATGVVIVKVVVMRQAKHKTDCAA